MFRINIESVLADLLRKTSTIVINWDTVSNWNIYLTVSSDNDTLTNNKRNFSLEFLC